ncbi:hypothetical protein BMW22_26200 (plasmid) [Rhizobium leguminosarum]|uniref:Uncharacterized protein n=1 Tax=Rhizobium leguminosarum TaxID=384 RepID=A0A1B1CMB7_RHILE|nr:hypothetical protein BA011_33945 [Rhizobium leguminosarum]API55119.1 hypothetical protein BMW22_26200 [Rhizobium leguminosarum]
MKSEEAREQVVLTVDYPVAQKSESFPPPQHRLKTSVRSTRRVEGLEAAVFGHVLLHPMLTGERYLSSEDDDPEFAEVED